MLTYQPNFSLQTLVQTPRMYCHLSNARLFMRTEKLHYCRGNANSPSFRSIFENILTVFGTYSVCVHLAAILMVIAIYTFFNILTTTTRTLYNCPLLAHSQRHRLSSAPFRNIHPLQFLYICIKLVLTYLLTYLLTLATVGTTANTH